MAGRNMYTDPAMNSGMMYNNPSIFSMGNPTLNRGYGSLGNLPTNGSMIPQHRVSDPPLKLPSYSNIPQNINPMYPRTNKSPMLPDIHSSQNFGNGRNFSASASPNIYNPSSGTKKYMAGQSSLFNSPNYKQQNPKTSGLNAEESQRMDHLFDRQNKMLSKMKTSTSSKLNLQGRSKFNSSENNDDLYDDMVNDLRGQQKTMRTDFFDKKAKEKATRYDPITTSQMSNEDEDDDNKSKKSKKKKKKGDKGNFITILRKEKGLKKYYHAKEAPYWKYIRDQEYDAGFNAGAIIRLGNIIALPQKIRYRVAPLIDEKGENELLIEELANRMQQPKPQTPSSVSTTSSERRRRRRRKKKHRRSRSSSSSDSRDRYDKSHMTHMTYMQPIPQQSMISQSPNFANQTRWIADKSMQTDFPYDSESRRQVTPPRKRYNPPPREEPSYSYEPSIERTMPKPKALQTQPRKDPKRTAKSHLRQFCWAMIYPALLFRDVDETVEQRKRAVLAGMTERLHEFMDFAIDFVLENCEVPLLDIYNETESMVVVSGLEKNKITDQDIVKRGDSIIEKLKDVLGSLTKTVKDGKMPPEFLKFMASISGNLCIPPQEYFTPFELSRLEFSFYATLKNVQPITIKMITGLFMMTRVLILKFFCHPWEIINGLEKHPHLIRNLKSCAAIIYHLSIEYFRKLRVNPNNQTHLPEDMHINPYKGGPIIAFDDEVDKKMDYSLVDEVLIGIYSRDKLDKFFTLHKAGVDELRKIIGEFFDSFFKLIFTVYEKERQKLLH